MNEPPAAVARTDGVLGELVLRRRREGGDELLELVSNGVFLMDDADGSTERELARAALGSLHGDGWHVVVGGLGLGLTAAAVLADPRVRRLTVVEVEPALVAWTRDGLVPSAAGLHDDPRAEVAVGDVAVVLPGLPERSVDAVLLDVDNGPDFLVHPDNAAVYGAPFLARAGARLRPGGVLAVWSADASPALATALAGAVGPVSERVLRVQRCGRDLDYWLYLATVSS